MVGDTRPLRIWGWLVVAMLLVEGLLHTPLGERIPEAQRWGNDRLASTIKNADLYAQGGPVDVLFFGSSQGATWIVEKDLRDRGMRAFNASIPGGNTVLADLVGSRIFISKLKPKLVVITVGPMSLSSWNQHFVRAVEGSAVGGPILRDDRASMWINEHIMLIRKGGQALSSETFRAWKTALFGHSVASDQGGWTPPLPTLETQYATFRSHLPDPAQFAALRHLRETAEAAGAKVLFINMPARDEAKVGAAWKYDDYLAQLRGATEGYPLLDLDVLAEDQHFSDYAHPSDAGKDAMRVVVAEFVGKFLEGIERK